MVDSETDESGPMRAPVREFGIPPVASTTRPSPANLASASLTEQNEFFVLLNLS